MFIGMAFDLKPYQVVLARSLEEEHYILNAKLPPDSSKNDFQRMDAAIAGGALQLIVFNGQQEDDWLRFEGGKGRTKA